MEHRPPREANRLSVGREILRSLWKREVHYRIYKILQSGLYTCNKYGNSARPNQNFTANTTKDPDLSTTFKETEKQTVRFTNVARYKTYDISHSVSLFATTPTSQCFEIPRTQDNVFNVKCESNKYLKSAKKNRHSPSCSFRFLSFSPLLKAVLLKFFFGGGPLNIIVHISRNPCLRKRKTKL